MSANACGINLSVISCNLIMKVMSQLNLEITPEKLQKDIENKAPLLIFDLREKSEFSKSHVDGSVHAVCDTRAKETIMPKIPKNAKIVLITDPDEMAMHTAKMMREFGLDAYYLKGGFSSWKGKISTGDTGKMISAEQLVTKINSKNLLLLDVRNSDEFSDYQIPGSVNIPLDQLFDPKRAQEIPKDKEIITICPHGNRAMVASFALERAGIKSSTLVGGLASWNQVLKTVKANDMPKIFQVQKIGKGCMSYIIESGGEAAVIDPLYPSDKYVDTARQHSFKITKVIDTHQHADHVSAARELAKNTGAELILSKYEGYDYEAKFVGEGDIIKFGNTELRTVHTPGHTPGSLSFVLQDKHVFTGDILFVESIGRPDLRDKAEEFTGELYNTLHEKLLKLDDSTRVFPAHHGEEVKPQNDVFSSTISESKRLPLLDLPKPEFIEKVVAVTLPRPMNYRKIISINKGELELVNTEVPDLEIGPNRCAINAI